MPLTSQTRIRAKILYDLNGVYNDGVDELGKAIDTRPVITLPIATPTNLPLPSTIGTGAYVTSADATYEYTINGWLEAGTTPTLSWTSPPNSSYTLSTSGSSFTITVAATHIGGDPVFYDHIATPDLADVATITSVGNIFTITPLTVATAGATTSATVTFRAYTTGYVDTATYSTTFTLNFTPHTKNITYGSNDISLHRSFGTSTDIMIDATYQIHGAPGIGATSPGAAYIYKSDTKLQNVFLGDDDGDNFGYSVALKKFSTGGPIPNARMAIVGAPAIGTGRSGYIKFYVDTGSGFNYVDTYSAPDRFRKDDDEYGYSVATDTDGTFVAVGAPGETIGANPGIGAVYVYEVTYNKNKKKYELVYHHRHTHPVTANKWTNSRFGHAVEISWNGNMLAIGAPGDRYAGIIGAGYVYVYEKLANSNMFCHQQSLNGGSYTDGITNGPAVSAFGSAIGLDDNGNTIVVGAPTGGLYGEGHIKVFNRDGTWDHLEDNYWLKMNSYSDGYDGLQSVSDDAAFGSAIVINSGNNVMAIGAPKDRLQNGNSGQYGSVLYYTRTTGNWSFYGKMLPSPNIRNGNFGQSVSISYVGSNKLVIGAPGNNSISNSGKVYRFDA